jgi:PAS domain-containing protein
MFDMHFVGSCRHTQLIIQQSVSDTSYLLQVLDALGVAQNEAINMMAFSAYPKFLTSKYYSAPSIGSSETKGSRDTDIVQGIKGEVTIVENSIQTKMSIELDKMLAGTSWLSGLLSSIESLPVCVSLAAASRAMRGFPLVYVNAAFETTTGYDRSEILGQVRQLVIGLESCLRCNEASYK